MNESEGRARRCFVPLCSYSSMALVTLGLSEPHCFRWIEILIISGGRQKKVACFLETVETPICSVDAGLEWKRSLGRTSVCCALYFWSLSCDQWRGLSLFIPVTWAYVSELENWFLTVSHQNIINLFTCISFLTSLSVWSVFYMLLVLCFKRTGQNLKLCWGFFCCFFFPPTSCSFPSLLLSETTSQKHLKKLS